MGFLVFSYMYKGRGEMGRRTCSFFVYLKRKNLVGDSTIFFVLNYDFILIGFI